MTTVTTEEDGAVYDRLQAASFAKASRATEESLDRRMTGGAIAEFLAIKRYAAVATTRPDGRPHAAMTGYFADRGLVWLPVMAGTARARNVESTGYACVIVTEGEGDQHAMVTLEGPASVVDEPDDETLARFEAHTGSRPTWATGWIRVLVDRVLTYAAVDSPYSNPAGGS